MLLPAHPTPYEVWQEKHEHEIVGQALEVGYRLFERREAVRVGEAEHYWTVQLRVGVLEREVG